MAQTTSPTGNPKHASPGGGGAPAGAGSAWAAGGAMFAGVVLLVDGVIAVLKGISGIANDDVYGRLGDYVYTFDTSAWGWIHLLLGVVLAFVGWGILKSAQWARATGVVLAGLSIVVNFMWLPYAPMWALVSIALGVFVIWSLCTASPARAQTSAP
ncbi:hypothetical protein [Streptomyces sp. AP-93]|uniref:DUF7144 family membrane protein n=1 Tax=Streptomyces sp. AP-93 TaxID=2929048 RepID=UPI001FAFC191|nr:hypothetical protein [Streptomyces sp. AP-93]MCJ0874545.1 hypothetical protein [Streptomyces sp. AP-93]